MMCRKSRLWCQTISMSVLIVLSAISIFGQTIDPNPDSPTPILISETDSARALANSPGKPLTEGPGRTKGNRNQTFQLNTKAVLYVTNLDLMEGEDATAFRLLVKDSKDRDYRFPVIDVQPVPNRPDVFAMTVVMRDELGFWGPPDAIGDIKVSVVWRGLASNWLRLGLGATGGTLPGEETLRPSPMPAVKTSGANRTAVVNAPEYVGYKYSGDRIRFLEQATFGPTAELDQRIRRIGLRTWLADQFEETYPTFAYPEFPLMSATPPSTCDGNATVPDSDPLCFRNVYSMYPMQNWFFKEAFYGNAQLKHRATWALSQMWVISGVDIQQSRHLSEYYKIIGRNAFGNYRTLMQEMTLNPGMGDYLDMVRSTKNNANENYAREILQLFSIGLFQLNQNGTVKLDATGNAIPTYDQTTVNNFTKVFTGWGFCEVTASCPNRGSGSNFIDPMLLNQNNHNVEAKTLLDYPNPVNKNIPAGLNGTAELSLALDNIYNHPNVAPFVSRFLIQHLVTSDPTPAYVGRVSAVFEANRTSPTQLKEVVKAILLDPEARGNVKTDPNYGKLREPVQLATNLLRQFNVQSADGTAQSDGYVAPQTNNMAQNVFYSPTVFNFYRAELYRSRTGIKRTGICDYDDRHRDFPRQFCQHDSFRTRQRQPAGRSERHFDQSDGNAAFAAADTTSNQLLDALNTKMMHGTMTAQNQSTMLTAINAVAATDPLTRAKTAIYLIATSSQYQVQR